jgi:drug/metabolite transporter (DMT)-like permease
MGRSAVAHDAVQPAWHGIALVLAGAVCFSTAILFVRLVEGLGALSIAFYRALFGWLFLALFTTRQRDPWQVRRYRAMIPRLVLLGVAVSLTVSLYTYAIRHTTAANAVLLVNSAPIYVALFGPALLGEPRARHTGLSLGLAIVGIVLVADPGNLDLRWGTLNGIAAGALSGLTYAVAMLIGRGLRGRVSGLTQTLWSLGITALVLLPWAFRPPMHALSAALPYLVPLGIFSLGLSYLTYFMGLARTRAQVVSVVALFEPVSGILIGMLAFGEVPAPLGWMGAGLVLLSMYLITRPQHHNNQDRGKWCIN